VLSHLLKQKYILCNVVSFLGDVYRLAQSGLSGRFHCSDGTECIEGFTMTFSSVLSSGTALAAFALAAPAMAAEDAPDGEQSGAHRQPSTEIVVTAPYERSRETLAAAVTVLQGDALQLQMRSTIGETLARQPGVSASFFGPNASRPILRGLDAERVRVLTDGIGSFDVSNTSVDHAVAINPLLADRIEIVRGPAALLYGSGAIGGVVNMRDLRIPRNVPEGGPHVDAVTGYSSAARERNVGASVQHAAWQRVRRACRRQLLRVWELSQRRLRFQPGAAR